MTKIKIKSKLTQMFGTTVNLPIDGLVEIDENGVLEVSEEAGKLLVEKTDDYELLYSKEADTSKKKETSTKKEAKKTESESTSKEDLEALEIPELISILEEAKIDKAKYEKFLTKKGLLVNFILKNIK